MIKYFFYISGFCVASTTLYAAGDQHGRLIIETMKFSFEVPCSPSTTIAAIKQAIYEEHSLPVDNIELRKKEWIRPGYIIPEKQSILLENDKTCAHYDLTDGSTIQCYLMPGARQGDA